MPPTALAVPVVASASKKMQQASRSRNPGADLAHASFSISEKSQQQFAFMWGGSWFTFTVSSQVYLNSQADCHNLVRRDLDLTHVSSAIIHYTYDIMTMLETEEQARSDVNAMVTHMTHWGWLINPTKVPGPTQQ